VGRAVGLVPPPPLLPHVAASSLASPLLVLDQQQRLAWPVSLLQAVGQQRRLWSARWARAAPTGAALAQVGQSVAAAV
jgi:hypothetical protein